MVMTGEWHDEPAARHDDRRLAAAAVDHGSDLRDRWLGILPVHGSPGDDGHRDHAGLAACRGHVRRNRGHIFCPDSRAASLAVVTGFRGWLGRGDRLGRLVHRQIQPISDDFRMAVPVGNVRGAARRPLGPDFARHLQRGGRVALPLSAASQSCLDRRGDRRGQPHVRRHHLPARLADRRPVRSDWNRSRAGSRRG